MPRLNIARYLFLTIATGAMTLAGCAVDQTVSVTSSEAGVQAPRQVQIVTETEAGTLKAAFGAAIRLAMVQHGFTELADGAMIGEFAITRRPAEVGIARPGATSAENVVWQSAPREKGLLDRCQADRVRGSLLLVDRESGEISYRGSAEADVCIGKDAPLAAMADALLADAASRLD